MIDVFVENRMKTITREELKARLDRQEPAQVVMALGRWAYERLRIPGSLNFATIDEALDHLSPDREVIVYCANPDCPASYRLYYHLQCLGFEKITRFAGGIEDWMEAGYPMEGSLAAELQMTV